jgi:PelA/Pel-15E family pectate lyase
MCVPVFLAFMATLATPLSAAIIGTNPPAQPVSLKRIETLPPAQQPVWRQYLKRSAEQLQADQAYLYDEMRRHGLKESSVPPGGRSLRGISLNQPADWYGQAEARRIADIVVSFQTPAGGWSKNLDLTAHPRLPGEEFAANNESRFAAPADNDTPQNLHWSYVGTFDNDATIAQLRYLAKVIAAPGTNNAAAYHRAFLRGLDYIFAAQYPNGGWPQVWPLQGGYHDAITYNDNAMINVMGFLRDVSAAKEELAFVPAKTRALAAASHRRGVECILATQIVVDGHRTVWGQQHDALTLRPAPARNYEMPSACAPESAGIILFLMQLPDPAPEIVTAVHAAAAWLEKCEIRDVAFRNQGSEGRLLIDAPSEAPLWARYYEIGSDRPIFGDRDKSIHDTVNEISRERRRGYAWYGGAPDRALERYADWSKAHPVPAPGGR